MHHGHVADVTQAHEWFPGDEEAVFADAAYVGANRREEVRGKNPAATWFIAQKRTRLRKLPEGSTARSQLEQAKPLKAKVPEVEHVFHVVKNLFGHRKTGSRGLAKNTAHLFTLFGLANLVIAARWSGTPQGQSAS